LPVQHDLLRQGLRPGVQQEQRRKKPSRRAQTEEGTIRKNMHSFSFISE
jgi:hypothetical protein